MFIAIAILFMLCGLLLLRKTRILTGSRELLTVIRVGAIGLILMGAVLAYLLISGTIEPPLS